MSDTHDGNLIFRALIILFLIAFGFYLGNEVGLLGRIFTGDRSYISYVILAIYLGATLHWLWLAQSLSRERRSMAALESELNENESGGLPERDRVGRLFASLRKNADHNPAVLLETFGDELANRHALGHFLSDVLLKLGLVGTVIGFILMLLPVGQMASFDPKLMQQLLASMSAGMSVALYTTLAGLITSTLLKAQYYLLDASLAEFMNRLIVLVDLHRDSDAT